MSTEQATKAVRTAYEYLMKTLIAGGTPTERLSNFRVEEVAQEETTKNFKITLSYDVSTDFQFDKKKEFKDFEVSENGETVNWMKIRKP